MVALRSRISSSGKRLQPRLRRQHWRSFAPGALTRRSQNGSRRFSLHYSVRLQMLVRKRFHVNTKPASTWRAARFLAGRSNFLSGRCVGAIEVLDELGSDNKLFCPPQTISNLEQVRVIVTYIEALPKRMTDGFGLLANEAMAKAWPCKT
jgi:Rap1a immunity proteins